MKEDGSSFPVCKYTMATTKHGVLARHMRPVMTSNSRRKVKVIQAEVEVEAGLAMLAYINVTKTCTAD